MFDPVEVGLNQAGEVAVFLGDHPGHVEGWYPESGRGIWLRVAGRIDRPLALSQEALKAACESASLLLVVVEHGRVVDERWIGRDVDALVA